MSTIQEQIATTGTPQAGEEGIDIRKIIGLVRYHWKWFAISVAACLTIAFLYLRYTTPVYKINATILVKDEKKGTDLGNADILQGLGGIGMKSNVDNEMEIFKSRTLMERTVREMELNVSYWTKGRVKLSEAFARMPFRFNYLPLNDDSIHGLVEYKFNLAKNGTFTLQGDAKQKEINGKLGDTLNLSTGRVVVEDTYYPITEAQDYTIKVGNYNSALAKYSQLLTVATPSKLTSTMNISINETVPEKGEAIVNKLIEVYLQANLDDRNRIADSTMSFIDERLALVGQELTGIEKNIQDFKQSNDITDITAQSKELLSNTSDYMKQLTDQQVQLSVIESLEKYLQDQGNSSRVVPASLIVQDRTFTSLIDRYNSLQLERSRMLMSTTEENPMVQTIDQQLSTLRGDIRSSLSSVKRGVLAGINQLQKYTGNLDSRIRQLPRQERISIDFSRQQAIKQELFLYLLKKREETAITKSSTIANARIVDAAQAQSAPISPKKSLIALSALLLGILIPSAAIYIKDLMNNKVGSKEDITNRTQLPVIGEISHSSINEQVVVKSGSKSQIAEQFRALRTNLQFMLTGDQKTILLTSSMSGEGKSFVAVNLACSLGLSGKKVVLLELDLRKPKISKALGLSNSKGFSTLMTNQSQLSEVIVNSGVMDNLFVIPSGPIPPNPAELFLMPELAEFFAVLRQNFDYIVIDTAPVGLVTDAQLLSAHSDVNIFLTRQGYTFKRQLEIPKELQASQKMKRICIVLNDVHAGGGYGYGYGYGYGGYGADSGYFDDGKQKKSNK